MMIILSAVMFLAAVILARRVLQRWFRRHNQQLAPPPQRRPFRVSVPVLVVVAMIAFVGGIEVSTWEHLAVQPEMPLIPEAVMVAPLPSTADAHSGADLPSEPTGGKDLSDRNCVKGKRCGNTCIPADETCHKNEEAGESPTAAAEIAPNAPDNSGEEATGAGTVHAHGTNKTHGAGSVHVRGYYRKDGTYVHPYTRRAPHRHRADTDDAK